jgi:4'-phosphopantetheinyl transferase
MSSTEVICENIIPDWREEPSFELADSVHVWKLRIPADEVIIAALEKLLNAPELEKASRFHQLKDNQCFIARQGVLRILLAKYARISPAAVKFTTGKNEKPEFENDANIFYNVSHSGYFILIAVSNSEVGVDIERANPRFLYTDVLKQSFNTAEIEHITTSANPVDVFFDLWTRKESLTKATSKGIDDDFPEIPSLDGQHTVDSSLLESDDKWQVRNFRLDEEYVASLAYPLEKQAIFFKFRATDILTGLID